MPNEPKGVTKMARTKKEQTERQKAIKTLRAKETPTAKEKETLSTLVEAEKRDSFKSVAGSRGVNAIKTIRRLGTLAGGIPARYTATEEQVNTLCGALESEVAKVRQVLTNALAGKRGGSADVTL